MNSRVRTTRDQARDGCGRTLKNMFVCVRWLALGVFAVLCTVNVDGIGENLSLLPGVIFYLLSAC